MEVTKLNKRRQSIKTILILVMCLLVAIPIVALTVVSAYVTFSEGKKAAYEVNDAQAGTINEELQTIFQKNISALQAFALAPSTIDFLGGRVRTEREYDDLYAQMVAIDEFMGDGNSTAISGIDGQQILRTKGDCVNVYDRDYFQGAVTTGEPYISDLNISRSTGKAIITFAVPVKTADGEVVGIVQRNFDASVLHDVLAEEVMQNRQEIVVVDRTGTVVAHSAREINVEDPEKQDQNPFYTDSRGDKVKGEYVAPFMGDTWIIAWEKIEGCDWIVASCRVQEVALSHVNSIVLYESILGVIFLAVALFIAVKASNNITRPLSRANDSISALTDGRFERIDKYTDRKDELGEIIRNTNSVMDKLEDIVGAIRDGAGAVNKSSDELADMANQISQNADDVSNAVQEIASGATHQADEITEATHQIVDIENAVSSVQSSTLELKETADKMQETSSQTAGDLERLRESSSKMNEAIGGITEKIGATSEAVGRINGMIDNIANIASQTNLLALNASIEAARAGDAGRGFAVVAEEIGKLASDSNNTAEQIRREMDELLKESQSAVKMAGEVSDTNSQQQEIINVTYDSVNGMIGDIEMTVSGVNEISENAEKCVVAKNRVVDVMESLSAISEENAASSEETGASMEELSATVTTLASSAGSLNEVSARLNDEVSFFKI